MKWCRCKKRKNAMKERKSHLGTENYKMVKRISEGKHAELEKYTLNNSVSIVLTCAATLYNIK